MRLKWDQDGERRYEMGVKKCVLYPMINGEYAKGVAWNGMTGITESFSGGDPVNIYADDIKYLELRGTPEFGATLEAYTYPNEFKICDGKFEYIPGVDFGQQARHPFGLCYRTSVGNDILGETYGYKIHLIYNATVGVSEKSYSSINDSPEAVSFSWDLTSTPTRLKHHKPTSYLIVDSTKCKAEDLARLEDILYGTSNEDSRLPHPDEVLEMMGGRIAFFRISRPGGRLIFEGPRDVDTNFHLDILEDGHLYLISSEAEEDLEFKFYLNNGRLYVEEA